VQTNVSIKEECILKNKNKLCPYKKLSICYNSCIKTSGSNLVYVKMANFITPSYCQESQKNWLALLLSLKESTVLVAAKIHCS
jgi:hypothetical protein